MINYKKFNQFKKEQNWRQQRKSSINNKKKLFFVNIKKRLFLYFIFTFLILLMIITIYISWLARTLPDPNRLSEREIPQSTKIFDRTGENLLYEIHGNEKRTLVTLDEIPDYVKQATISIEDKNFYKHKGFSLWAIFRTMVTNIIKHRKAGGSTLTQQFIKNSVLSSEKTYTRKLKEIILAYKLEQRYSKDEILQMYLNEIPYGSTAYGIEAASQKYFGISVKDINLAQAAVLAALPQAPTRYSPYGSNKDLLMARQKYILDLMRKEGYITKEQEEEAKNTEIVFSPPTTNIKAPHFVMYVKEILSQMYGEKMIEQGGLKIYTTLDLYKQEIAERIVKEYTEKNKEKYNATNASLVSIDPKTGEILAMVGSKDYFDDEIDGQVNIATSKRQPGSSMKPLVYAAMFSKGYTPDTILYDVITNFSNDKNKPYEPHNYDNKEHGAVTVRKALAGSLNIPAVKAIYLAGINNVLDLANELGYTTLDDRDRYGLSLVLGGGEVKLLEHTNAYSAFAREGLIRPPKAIIKILDNNGKTIKEFPNKKEGRVLDPKIARQINDILADNNARAYAFGVKNWLTLGSRPIAAKTGTTNDYRDAWTIGYTPSLVTGVWVGNNDNTKMKKGAAGGTVAAPIWHDYMKEVLGDTPIEYFKKPEKIITNKPVLDGKAAEPVKILIDKASGLLATEYTPKSYIEEKEYYEPHCILYYVDKDNPRGEKPEHPEKDSQFNLWENAVQEWAKKEKFATSTEENAFIPPTEKDNLHIPENLPKLTIIYPTNNQNISGPFLSIKIKTSSNRGIKKVYYYLNDNLFFTSLNPPFNLYKQITFLNNGFHNIKIKACDDIDNCTEKELEFNYTFGDNNKNKPINISITSPANGLAVTNYDFPLDFNININHPEQVASISLFYEKEDQSKNIQKINNIRDKNITITWTIPPPTGSYKIKTKTKTWNTNQVNEDNIYINVNNINFSTSTKEN